MFDSFVIASLTGNRNTIKVLISYDTLYDSRLCGNDGLV